jgi:hypothetical protein
MASKIAWLVSKRGAILVIATVLSAGLGLFGVHVRGAGMWDG